MDIFYIIKDLVRKRNLEEWFDERVKGRIDTIFDKSIFEGVITKNGIIFPFDKNFIFIFQVYDDYKWDQIRPSDIVIDIGANMGGFTANAAKMCNRVLAVEPVMTDILKKTISLNKFSNVEVLEAGLGDGSSIIAEWTGDKKKVRTFTLTQLKNIIGGCDVLKCDCEGYEWFIKPEELEGIRNIQIEIHPSKNPSPNNPETLVNYLKFNYDFICTPHNSAGTMVINAERKI